MTKALKILVTGGLGFLGSHLCERLVAQGHEVISLDNHSSGSIRNVESLEGSLKFMRTCREVEVPIHLEVDQIYNLACPASPVAYQKDPIKTFRTNVMGALTMLDLAQCHGARILQASTSEVYGSARVHPQTETYWGNVNPTGVRACYNEGKRCAETLFFDYHRQHRLEIKVARIFNTYGPRMSPTDGRVVSNFIVQALKGGPLTVYGFGTQTRSFCYVDDMVDGLIRLMNSASHVTGPVNLGNPQEVTMLDLAKTIIRMTGSSSRIGFKPLPADDPERRCPDIKLAQQTLEWAPTTPLVEGLRKTIQYFENTL